MDDFVAYPSRKKILLLMLGSMVFVGLGLWMAGVFGPAPSTGRYSTGFTHLIGWAAVTVFGLGLVMSFRRLLSRSELLRIGPAGIRSGQWSDRIIPWSEIVDITLWTHRSQTVIVLHLRDAGRFPGRGLARLMVPANRILTGGDIPISLTGADSTVDEALLAIARCTARWRPHPRPE